MNIAILLGGVQFAAIIPVVSNNLLLGFLKLINIMESESIQIVVYCDEERQPLFTNGILEIPYNIGYSHSLNTSYCNGGLRNTSGILIVSSRTLQNTVELLDQFNRLEPSCKYKAYHPTVFMLLDQDVPYPSFGEVILALKQFAKSWSSFSINTNIYVVPIFGGSANISPPRIIEIYQIKNLTVVQEVFPTDGEFTGFTIEAISSRNRRMNFQQQLIKTIIYKTTSRRYNDTVKVFSENLMELSMVLNITYSNVYGDSWIQFDKLGNPLGIGKLLQNSEGDILSQANELSLERQAVFDFIYPNIDYSETGFFKQPSTLYPNLIFQPFSLEAWITFAISFAVFCIFIYFLSPFASGRYPKGTTFKMFGLFAQQGWPDEISNAELGDTLSIRITLISGLIFSWFFYNLYSARIISIISWREPPIQNVQQLLSSGVHLMVDSDARNAYRFLTKLSSAQRQEAIKTTEDGFNTVIRNSSAAFFTYRHYLIQSNTMQKYSFQKFCETISSVELDLKALPMYHGMYVKKHSPLRKLFLHAHIRRAESGLKHRHTLQFFKIGNPQCLEKLNEIESLDAAVLLPVFILSFSMGLLSLVGLMIERITVKISKKSWKVYSY